MRFFKHTRRKLSRKLGYGKLDYDRVRRSRKSRQMQVEALENRHLLAVITTLAELQAMSLSGSHTLGNDIDASSAWFTPVGTIAAPFTGSLDGMGYKITGLKTSTSAQYVGLFGYTSGATLNDVELQNVDINATYGTESNYVHVGALVGKAVNTSISNSEVSGDIDADSYGGVYAGGLVGYSSNTSDKDLVSSKSSATVDGRSDINNNGYGGYGGYVGGLVGRADGLDVSESSASGAVTAYGGSSYGGELQYAGGLIGYNYLSVSSGSNDGEVLNSSATGYVHAVTAHSYGGAYAGGLIGYNYLASSSTGTGTITIQKSFSSGTAEADAYGYGSSPNAYAGGLVGYNYVVTSGSGSATTTIDHSFATGTADASASSTYGGAYGYSGGLIGYNSVSSTSTGSAVSTVDESYATGTVSAYGYGGGAYGGYYGGAYAGGLLGYEYLSKGASATASATVSNTYATGNVTARAPADAVAGGLIGSVSASGTTAQVTNSYSTGVPDTQYDASPLEGGLVGYSSSVTYTSNYWDTQTSGKTDGVDNIDPDPSGVTGKTTAQMKQQSTFVGWDFDNNGGGAGTVGVWYMSGYPHLQMEYYFLLGNSTHISNLAQLQAMALDLSEDYYLDNDIDASATTTWNWNGSYYEGFQPVGNLTNMFVGSLDGQGHAIQNLTINRPSADYQGLFGAVGTAGLVQRVGMTGTNVSTYATPNISDNVGGIAGKNKGTIRDCYVTGTLDANDDIGGITGHNEGGTIERCWADITIVYRNYTDNIGGIAGDNEGGTIRESFSLGTITGYTSIGGLVGQQRGTIEDSYSWASVNADWIGGGLIGYGLSGSVTRSYSKGAVTGTNYLGGFVGYNSGTTYTNDYWDITTSGKSGGSGNPPDPSGVTGLTDAQAKSQASYTGWDFDVSGVAARDNGIWILAGYPHLQMEWSASIKNVYQLQLMALDLDANYALANNIALSSSVPAMDTWNGGAGFKPVGTFVAAAGWAGNAQESYHPDTASAFTGTLDGQNFEISGLLINRSDEASVGLFGAIYDSRDESVGGLYTNAAPSQGMVAAPDAVTARVQNLTLKDVRVAGGSFVGALAGRNYARIRNSKVTTTSNDYGDDSTAFVKGGGDRNNGTTWYGSNIGGLVGSHFGVIRDSGAEVYVSFNHVNRGGIDYDAHLNDTAGFVGDNNDLESDLAVPVDRAMIFSSYAKGSVIAQQVRALDAGGALLNTNIGGFVGESDGIIQGTQASRCYASGAVRGFETVGGFAGKNDGPISWAYATGDVNASRGVVGGFAGENEDDIDNSYATGSVTLFILDNGALVSAHHADLEYFLVNDDLDVSVGGFVGINQDGHHDGTAIRGETDDGAQIRQSYATGNVTLGTPHDDPSTVGVDERIDIQINATGGGADTLRFNVGGFVGYQDNNGAELIDQSYYKTGTVTVDLQIGVYHEHNTDGSPGPDSGEIRLWVGGFIGRHKRTVQYVYTASGGVQDGAGGLLNTADIVIGTYTLTGTVGLAADVLAQVGGLVGSFEPTNGAIMTDSFWDFQTVEPDHDALNDIYQDFGSAAGTLRAKTTAQMQTQATYTNWLFDAAHWELDANDYPEFWWED